MGYHTEGWCFITDTAVRKTKTDTRVWESQLLLLNLLEFNFNPLSSLVISTFAKAAKINILRFKKKLKWGEGATTELMHPQRNQTYFHPKISRSNSVLKQNEFAVAMGESHNFLSCEKKRHTMAYIGIWALCSQPQRWLWFISTVVILWGSFVTFT